MGNPGLHSGMRTATLAETKEKEKNVALMAKLSDEGRACEGYHTRGPRIKMVSLKEARPKSNLTIDGDGQGYGIEVAKNWYLDSGATCHMTFDMKSFSNYQGTQPLRQVVVGNKESLTSPGIGIVCLKLLNGKCGVLEDVMYVPQMTKNLL
ncbi:hypothetical protein O6H91_18G056400 [Diphasiastrum complanatum]|uniref:Uncharacterized protein n=1 Tax=Diphasiastrum complanatum TaxID=34168 RepID=A0ACC2B1J0_DIPCM|nr:hypothetical protein O6H91_18G056400 [Diphasiastrum complanatum]